MKVAIVGAGKMGVTLAEALLGGGNELTIIDKNEELIQKLSSRFDAFTVAANGKSTEVLKDLGIGKYDLLIALTDTDEKNIVIASFAKKIGCKRVIARVNSPEHVEQFDFIKKSMGIDYIISPDIACASEISKYLTVKYTFKGGRFVSNGVTILEMPISEAPDLINKQLKDCFELLNGLLIGAVSRNGKVLVPSGKTTLLEEDILYLIGTEAKINEEIGKARKRQFYTDLKTVMIAGGGKTGFYLAERLRDFGASVKIIESDRKRCEYLSAKLDGVLVLNGDATDPNLLREENMQGTDAFVAVTGFDEANLLLALVAAQNHIEDVVAKVSRKSYEPLIDTMGVAMIINPLDVCTANALRFIKNDAGVVFSQLIQGQAEFSEIVAKTGMLLTSNTLAELEIPEGVLVAAIHRGNEIIIPKGSTRISDGDKVLILSMLSSTPSLEALLKY